MSIYIKIWFVLLSCMLVSSWLVGFLSMVRGGCHIYRRWDAQQAQAWCVESAATFSTCGLVLIGLSAGPQAILKGLWFVAPLQLTGFSAGIVTLAIIALSFGITSFITAVVFRMGKLLKLRILRRQTLRQRAKCRKEGFLACIQPQPCECPIGLKRPLFVVDDQDAFRIASDSKKALAEMAVNWGAKDGQSPCLYTTMRAYALFGGKRVRVSASIADELQSIADASVITTSSHKRFAGAAVPKKEVSA